MVGNNIDSERGTLKVVTPGLEYLKNCKQFLVVDIIVELRT